MKKSALGYQFKFHGVGNDDPLTVQILKSRGLSEDFLNPALFDPSAYMNSAAYMAAIEIIDAINNGRPIIIVGDYDVDGTTSIAILMKVLEMEFCTANFIIPNRFNEGYGLTDNVAKRVLAMNEDMGGNTLIICVDNGTASKDQIDMLMSKGMRTVIIDHHEVDRHKAATPNVLFNPHLTGPHELRHSCAALLCMIVSFVISELRGTGSIKFIKHIGQLAGIATVADVMPLKDENRSLVKKAIASIRHSPILPISRLIEITNIERQLFGSQDISFQIAPRLNAPGRIDTAELTAKYLMSSDYDYTDETSAIIDSMNTQRKDFEKSAVEEAMQIADREKQGIIGVYSTRWKAGVVGLVASRLLNLLGQPILAGYENEKGIIIGSGRSIPGIDLGAAVREAVEQGMLIKGGGHAMACGFTCHKDNFNEAVKLIENIAYDEDPAFMTPPDKIREFDLKIGSSLLTVEQWKDLDRAEPFGNGFPSPSFAVQAKIISIREIKNDGVKIKLSGGSEATIFGATAREIMPYINENKSEDLIFGGNINLSTWRGNEKLDFIVNDVTATD